MKIVLPILFAALAVGLFTRRITTVHWLGLSLWVVFIVVYSYFRH